MGDARGQHADARHLFRLYQMQFLHTPFGDVAQKHQRPGLALGIDDGRGGHVEVAVFAARAAFGEGNLRALSAQGLLHRAVIRAQLLFGMKEFAAGFSRHGLLGKQARTDVVAVLNAPQAVVDHHAVADGIEHRLQLAFLGAQVGVGDLQFADFLFDFGIIADF